ncbi:hypothetical protein H0H93_012274 [Arthromyces matolae]|nr:hypothetical protein H0H93_012274 [Arthromyces matolae]
MNIEASGTTTCRVPTLVQLCQRVCVSNLDSISGLGEGLRYELVHPILERCNAQQLLRLEENSPHLENDTNDIWKELCYSAYPLAVERYPKGSEHTSGSWKEYFFFLKDAEARRLEEASAKLRSQRLEAEERKKEREVKITDRLPPPKRQRTGGWGSNPAPKTLFQKTRTDASKMHKNLFSRMLPPMPPNGKTFAVQRKASAADLDFLPPTSGPSRVTVNNVVRRVPATTVPSTSKASTSPALHAGSAGPSTTGKILPAKRSVNSVTVAHSAPAHHDKSPDKSLNKPADASNISAPESKSSKPSGKMKKDPLASMFVPKHRAHSQLRS